MSAKKKNHIPNMYDLFDPQKIEERTRRLYAPILRWLEANLKTYGSMRETDLIRLIRRRAPEARGLDERVLRSLIQIVANRQGFTPPPPIRQTSNRASTRLSFDPSQYTEFHFNWGASSWNIKIPSSLKGRLPIKFRRVGRIIFAMSASGSGFEFSIKLDSLEYVQIKMVSSVDPVGNKTIAGLQVIARRNVCQAQNPYISRRYLEAKGKKLSKAMNKLQRSSAPKQGEKQSVKFKRLKDVVGAIADLYSAAEKAKAFCKQAPIFSVGLGTETPLYQGRAKKDRRGGSVNLNVIFRF